MPDWKKLEVELVRLNTFPCDFPEGISEVQKKAFLRHNHAVLALLRAFTQLSLSDAEKEIIFRLFLEIRWRVINNSSIDYTLNPFFPANQACLLVAEAIAKEDEAVCQILMPSIKSILGSAFSAEEVKDASQAEGRFLPTNYLVRLDGKALFSVLDFYSLIAGNTALFFPSEEDETPAFHFSAEDTQRIRDITGKSSQCYFDEIQRIHYQTHGETPSIGYQLRALQRALYRSSKDKKGSEEVADISECRQPVLNFARIWFPLLETLKADVVARRADGSSLALGSYLLCLFAYTEGVSLEEGDYERVRQEEIIECTHQISLQISSILKQHPDLFDIPLLSADPLFEKLETAGREKTALRPDELETLFAEWDVFFHQLETGDYSALTEKPLPNKETLALMLAGLEKGLEKRSPLRGFNDVDCLAMLPFFDQLSAQCFTQDNFTQAVFELAKSIQTIEAMRRALMVVPIRYWSSFMSHIPASVMLRTLGARTGSSDYEYMLSGIPSSDWHAFFDAIKNCAASFNASTLGALFYTLSASELPTLLAALGKKIDTILSDGADLFYLLAASLFINWEKVIALLHTPIKNILKNPESFATVFLQIEPEEKSFLMERLGEMITSLVTHVSFLESVLKNLPGSERVLFLELAAPFLKNMSLTQAALIRIVNLCHPLDFANVMNALKSVGSFDFFNSDIDLASFLSHFTEAHRIIILRESSVGFLPIKVKATGLRFLIMRFPECEKEFLNMFRSQLPGVLKTFFSGFALADDFEHEILPAYVNTFCELVAKILPVILSHACLKNISVSYDIASLSFFTCSEPRVCALRQRVGELEKKAHFGEITGDQAIMQKIRLLSDFMGASEKGRSFHGMFYDDLVTFFGKDFFPLLEKAIERFHLFTAVGIPNPLSLLPYHHVENFEDSSDDESSDADNNDLAFLSMETGSNASTMSLS